MHLGKNTFLNRFSKLTMKEAVYSIKKSKYTAIFDAYWKGALFFIVIVLSTGTATFKTIMLLQQK